MKILALTFNEFVEEMRLRYGKGRCNAAVIYREILKKNNTLLTGLPEFSDSQALAMRIAGDICFTQGEIIAQQEDEGVLKFATRFTDGAIIESVIIPARGRTTLCVSSQAGCRMGCAFCATGQEFVRDLTADEITGQLYTARFTIKRSIDNIVFMGMGEPFDNFDNVMQAVRILSDQRGLDIPLSHITISTSGHADGIRRLAEMKLHSLRLAVSLNAADDDLRSTLMPINRRYPLDVLIDVLRKYPLGKNGLFFIEYVLIAGVNDSKDMAKKVAQYLHGLPVRINVIVCNKIDSVHFVSPEPEQVSRFCRWLVEEKLFVRRRLSQGSAIMGACGQLRSAHLAGKVSTCLK